MLPPRRIGENRWKESCSLHIASRGQSAHAACPAVGVDAINRAYQGHKVERNVNHCSYRRKPNERQPRRTTSPRCSLRSCFEGLQNEQESEERDDSNACRSHVDSPSWEFVHTMLQRLHCVWEYALDGDEGASAAEQSHKQGCKCSIIVVARLHRAFFH